MVLEKEEIDKIKLKTTNTIEIKEFIEADDLDPIFFEKDYYIGPIPVRRKWNHMAQGILIICQDTS